MMVSASHGRGQLEDRGCRLSSHEVSAEQRGSATSLTASEEAVVGGGAQATTEEKWVGDKLWKLQA